MRLTEKKIKQIYDHLKSGKRSYRQIADILDVNVNSIMNYKKIFENTGEKFPRTRLTSEDIKKIIHE